MSGARCNPIIPSPNYDAAECFFFVVGQGAESETSCFCFVTTPTTNSGSAGMVAPLNLSAATLQTGVNYRLVIEMVSLNIVSDSGGKWSFSGFIDYQDGRDVALFAFGRQILPAKGKRTAGPVLFASLRYSEGAWFPYSTGSDEGIADILEMRRGPDQTRTISPVNTEQTTAGSDISLLSDETLARTPSPGEQCNTANILGAAWEASTLLFYSPDEGQLGWVESSRCVPGDDSLSFFGCSVRTAASWTQGYAEGTWITATFGGDDTPYAVSHFYFFTPPTCEQPSPAAKSYHGCHRVFRSSGITEKKHQKQHYPIIRQCPGAPSTSAPFPPSSSRYLCFRPFVSLGEISPVPSKHKTTRHSACLSPPASSHFSPSLPSPKLSHSSLSSSPVCSTHTPLVISPNHVLPAIGIRKRCSRLMFVACATAWGNFVPSAAQITTSPIPAMLFQEGLRLARSTNIQNRPTEPK
ncbi:hypothetical protein MKZ38_001770 [Zalerion maritima]|uniref:Uncharacterized protein n=1 Tax=Zalerion maritima TaxID=339359 RepID=A0AAD5RXD6_9PEZI|nr:hypothetical protein MKZ38_001770 [Zalerion maritima]